MSKKEKPKKAVITKSKAKKKTVKKPLITLKQIASPRQIIAVKALSEAVRKSKGKKSIAIGKIMREAGYSVEFSKQPSRIIKSKSFQELLAEYLPDDLLSKTHSQIITAKSIDHRTFPTATTDEEIKEIIESVSGCVVKKIQHGEQANHVWYWTPDNTSRLSAIKEGYRVRNKYPAEKHEIETTIKFEDLNDEELDKAINAIKQS